MSTVRHAAIYIIRDIKDMANIEQWLLNDRALSLPRVIEHVLPLSPDCHADVTGRG